MVMLKQKREDKKVSRYALAKMTGISYRSLMEIEKGGDVRVSTLHKIAKALEINIKELFEEK